MTHILQHGERPPADNTHGLMTIAELVNRCLDLKQSQIKLGKLNENTFKAEDVAARKKYNEAKNFIESELDAEWTRLAVLRGEKNQLNQGVQSHKDSVTPQLTWITPRRVDSTSPASFR